LWHEPETVVDCDAEDEVDADEIENEDEEEEEEEDKDDKEHEPLEENEHDNDEQEEEEEEHEKEEQEEECDEEEAATAARKRPAATASPDVESEQLVMKRPSATSKLEGGNFFYGYSAEHESAWRVAVDSKDPNAKEFTKVFEAQENDLSPAIAIWPDGSRHEVAELKSLSIRSRQGALNDKVEKKRGDAKIYFEGRLTSGGPVVVKDRSEGPTKPPLISLFLSGKLVCQAKIENDVSHANAVEIMKALAEKFVAAADPDEAKNKCSRIATRCSRLEASKSRVRRDPELQRPSRLPKKNLLPRQQLVSPRVPPRRPRLLQRCHQPRGHLRRKKKRRSPKEKLEKKASDDIFGSIFGGDDDDDDKDDLVVVPPSPEMGLEEMVNCL
jgi:hypothetical protein